MTTATRTAMTVAAAALALTSCSSPGTADGPPAACLDDMRAAANEPDSTRADPILISSLTSCQTADQWLDALRRYPAAMGLNGPDAVGPIDLQAACGPHPNTPVCTSR
jgi:hypothetical protein